MNSQVFRAKLEARAAHLTQDTKNALFGVRRFQRFLLQKRSGDEAVTSLVTSVFWTKFGCFGAFWDQKTKINWSLSDDLFLTRRTSLRSSFMSGRLYCLASTESKSCWSSATSASAISVFTRCPLSDKFVKLVLRPRCPCCPRSGWTP